MKRFIFAFAIFFTCAWLMLQISTLQNKPLPPAPTQYLEWFGKNITLTEMDTSGKIKQVIFAKQLHHYMPDNITDLTDVDVKVFSADEHGDWALSSDKGRLFHGKSKQDIVRVDLWQHVQLLRPQHLEQEAVTINTSTLAIFPAMDYAHTDQFTTIEQPGQKMSGYGMEIFFESQKFHLLNNVSSTHENAS